MNEIKKFLLICENELASYKEIAKDKDVRYLDSNFIDNPHLLIDWNDYDVTVISYIDERDKFEKINHIFNFFTRRETDCIVFDKIDNVQYDTNFYYVLSVRSGEYEDSYEKVIGVFKTRKKAEEYYHKYCEITQEEVDENNKEFESLEESEPKLEDFELENGVYDEEAYNKALSEHWENSVDYMPYDSATSIKITKVRLFE